MLRANCDLCNLQPGHCLEHALSRCSPLGWSPWVTTQPAQEFRQAAIPDSQRYPFIRMHQKCKGKHFWSRVGLSNKFHLLITAFKIHSKTACIRILSTVQYVKVHNHINFVHVLNGQMSPCTHSVQCTHNKWTNVRSCYKWLRPSPVRAGAPCTTSGNSWASAGQTPGARPSIYSQKAHTHTHTHTHTPGMLNSIRK